MVGAELGDSDVKGSFVVDTINVIILLSKIPVLATVVFPPP